MASKDFLPSGGAALLSFARNYSDLISAEPESFGLSELVAAQLADLTAEYAAKLAALETPSNRHPIAFLEKRQAMAELMRYIRATARTIQGSMTITDAQRTSLGLPIRKPHRTPAAAIAEAPELKVVSVIGRHVRIRLRGASGPGRSRPGEARGAMVFSFVAGPGGEPPPAGRAGWLCHGTVHGGSVVVNFPPTVPPGATVYLAAQWYNTRGAGPGCTPVAVVIGIDAALQRAA